MNKVAKPGGFGLLLGVFMLPLSRCDPLKYVVRYLKISHCWGRLYRVGDRFGDFTVAKEMVCYCSRGRVEIITSFMKHPEEYP